MSRYIDAEPLLTHIKNMPWKMTSAAEISKIIFLSAVEEAPTADVVEVRHGEWIERSCGELQCSVCGIVQEDEPHRYNYCPCCGAKMDGERKDNANKRSKLKEI